MPPLSTTYHKSMLNHPYGYALYEPESTTHLTPGSCGYLTPLGQWTPLLGTNNIPIHLSDATSLTNNNLTPFPNFHPAPSDKRTWGPKTSSHTKVRKVEFEAGVSALPAGIPASIGSMYKFSSGDEGGAVLMTQAPVIKESVYGSSVFRAWSNENAARIIMQWPDMVSQGLIIVTSTYSTELAMINAWTSVSKEISVGFKGGVVEIGELGPSTSWYTAHGDGGWVESRGEGGGRKVVFFGGLVFKYRWLGRVLPSEHKFKVGGVEKVRLRDGEDGEKEFRVVVGGEEVLVSGEVVGEVVEGGDVDGEDEDEDF